MPASQALVLTDAYKLGNMDNLVTIDDVTVHIKNGVLYLIARSGPIFVLTMEDLAAIDRYIVAYQQAQQREG